MRADRGSVDAKDKFKPNLDQRDILGSDPYGLRLCQQVPIRSFADSIQETCLNLEDLDLSAMSMAEAQDGYVPQRLFFIWFGSAFDSAVKNARKTVSEWREKNPNLVIVLFTDQVDKASHESVKAASSSYQDMLEFAKTNNVCIINHAEYMTPTVPLQMGLLQKNYGMASDVFRLDLLSQTAGIYADIDIEAMALPDQIHKPIGFALNRSGVYVKKEGFHGKHPSAFSNDYLMMASGNHEGRKIVQELRKQLTANVSMTWSELFNKLYEAKPYKFLIDKAEFRESYQKKQPCEVGEDIINHEYERFTGFSRAAEPNLYPPDLRQGNFLSEGLNALKKFMTETATGPELFVRFQSQCDDVGLYTSRFEASWLPESNRFNPLKSESDDQLIKRLVTIILFDLAKDPETLRLDRLSSVLGNDYVCKHVTEILGSYFQENIHAVKKVVLSKENTTLVETVHLNSLIEFMKMVQKDSVQSLEVTFSPGSDGKTDFLSYIKDFYSLGNWEKDPFFQGDDFTTVLNKLEKNTEFLYREICALNDEEPADAKKILDLFRLKVVKDYIRLFVPDHLDVWVDKVVSLDKRHYSECVDEFISECVSPFSGSNHDVVIKLNADGMPDDFRLLFIESLTRAAKYEPNNYVSSKIEDIRKQEHNVNLLPATLMRCEKQYLEELKGFGLQRIASVFSGRKGDDSLKGQASNVFVSAYVELMTTAKKDPCEMSLEECQRMLQITYVLSGITSDYSHIFEHIEKTEDFLALFKVLGEEAKEKLHDENIVNANYPDINVKDLQETLYKPGSASKSAEEVKYNLLDGLDNVRDLIKVERSRLLCESLLKQLDAKSSPRPGF